MTTLVQQMNEIGKQIAEQINNQTLNMKEYRLMYKFGAWVTSCVICAESDAEAIFDADMAEKKAISQLPYALWCGKRLVKAY